MQVLYSPVRSDEVVEYIFNGDILTILYNNEQEEYDFTNMPDGILEDFISSFPYKFLISAEKTDGVLYLTLLNFIGKDAFETERFPDWIEV